MTKHEEQGTSMNIEDQIAQILNPQEFTRLCNTVLTAKYAEDFQVIDGTRSDEGNDGYIISEKRVIAMHCPIKPERKQDKDYLEKIRSDLKKTDALRRSGKYEIENWTFLTPRKLSNNVIATMIEEAKTLHINANHQESTYLASELYKNKHLILAFSFLYLPEIENKLDEILRFIKGTTEKAVSSDIDKNHLYKPDTKDNKEFDHVAEIRKREQTERAKLELKSIFYKATDPVVQLNALLGILDFYNPIEDSAESMIELCEKGVQIAKKIEKESVQAYFLSQKGYFLSFIYSEIDLRTAFQIKIDNVIGIPTITEEQRQDILKKLSSLEQDYTQAFNEALELAKKSLELESLASVLISIGNAAGQRSLYLRPLGVVHRADREKKICKEALLMAKNVYIQLVDELGIGIALFNLANQIRFFGEEKEALELTIDVIEVAEKFDNKLLLKKAKWLKETLETGRIPDYVHGERRE